MSTNPAPVATLEDVTIAVDKIQLGRLSERMPIALRMANEYAITDEETFEASLPLIQSYIEAQNQIEAFFKESKELAFKTHRSISGLEKTMIAPFKEAENTVALKRRKYREDQERVRQAKEDAEREAARQVEHDLAIKAAEELASQGEHDAATQIIEQAISAPAPAIVVPSTVPKQKGTSQRGRWVFRIDDEDAIERLYCSPDESKIRKVVEALGDKCGIKGISVTWQETEAFRRR